MSLSTSATPAADIGFNLNQNLLGLHHGVQRKAGVTIPEPNQLFHHFGLVRQSVCEYSAVFAVGLSTVHSHVENFQHARVTLIKVTCNNFSFKIHTDGKLSVVSEVHLAALRLFTKRAIDVNDRFRQIAVQQS